MVRSKTKITVIIAGFIAAMAMSMLALVMQTQPVVRAQGGGGLRISPVRYDFTVEAGERESFQIVVKNVLPTTMNVEVEVSDFESDGETGRPKLLIGSDEVENYQYSLKPYVEGPTQFTLDPDEERTLDYAINYPDDVTPGARFGLIRFNPSGGAGEGTEGVTLSASLGTIVIASTPGEVVELASFIDMVAGDAEGNGGFILESAPTHLATRIGNEGETFVQPFGDVVIKDWGGNVIQSFEFNNFNTAGEGEEAAVVGVERDGILPQSQRIFFDELEGIGSFGKYTVEANISYGDGSNIIPVKIDFWVVPWRVILVAIVVLVALLLMATRGIKMYNKSVVRKSRGARHEGR